MKNLLVACYLIFGLYSLAQATITDHDDYTHDSATGLYWLDVTLTQGLTYWEVSQRLQPGAPLDGWRYAVHTELETLIQNFGIPPQGQTCYATSMSGNLPLYCDDIDSAYAETLEDIIRMLGDTEATIWNPNPFNKDVSPTGAGMTRGIIAVAPGTYSQSGARGIVWLEDGEFVYGRSTTPYQDAVDEIRSLYPANPAIESYYGSFLVRDTEPTLPITIDLNPLPLPDVPAHGHLLFDNLAPEALGLTINCLWTPCSYGAQGFTAYTADGDYYETGSFGLELDTGFDAQAQPWMRITGFDFTGATSGGGCTMENPVVHPGTRESITDLSLFEGGNGFCRVALADVDYSFLPPAAANTGWYRGVSNTYIDYSSESGGPYWSYTIDNVIVEFMPPNMTISFDPWQANKIRPTAAYAAPVDLLSTSVASGDAFDFDATKVDLATLTLGPGMAPNVASPLFWDRDGDGDIDMTIGFRVEASGLGCLDTEVTVTGRTLAGEPLFGRASVTPVDCAKAITMDVDPFNAVNEIRPDDAYTVLVGVMSTSTSAGEAADVDAMQIDPASLRLGPAGAPSILTPLTTDLDGDTDTDVIFAFAVADSGIACGDTDVMLEGEQYDGWPIAGTDNIVTVDCVESGCHP